MTGSNAAGNNVTGNNVIFGKSLLLLAGFGGNLSETGSVHLGSQGRSKIASKNTGLPGWLLLFTGLVTGLFIAFLYYLASITPDENVRIRLPSVPESRVKGGGDGPVFNFYELLPKSGSARQAGGESLSQPATLPSAESDEFTDTKKAPGVDVHMLQVGAFQHLEDARKRRAALLLLGLPVDIKAAEVNGKTWQRVYVGPLSSAAELARVQRLLNDNHMPFIVARIAG